ncbi:MAG: N-acetylmuramoyl-L-alanine amidase-like domain-containing protein [Melioribacteraceae bacterium]
MKKIFLFVLVLWFSSNNFAQTIYTQKDVDLCNSKFRLAVDKNLSSLPINQIIVEIGKSFLGTDYSASSLEKGDEEKLVVHLTGLDCYTFLESSLVFARCIKEGKTSFDDYQNELANIRYRGGKLEEYPSRLHYFSDWIFDMNKRGIGKDITKEIGGKPYEKKINFMSTHVDAYHQLKNNPKFVDEIAKIEKEISSRKYFYIPQDEILKVEDKIQSGDIVGITTNVEGLDIAHTGIAIRMEDGRIHLMHAPNVGYKVQITEKPLADYIKGNKKQTGIMVLRVSEVSE